MAKLHEMLTYLRKKKDMSQQELADKIGVSRSTVGMYETGKREPEIDILQKLSDIYGVSMNTLLDQAVQRFDAVQQAVELSLLSFGKLPQLAEGGL